MAWSVGDVVLPVAAEGANDLQGWVHLEAKILTQYSTFTYHFHLMHSSAERPGFEVTGRSDLLGLTRTDDCNEQRGHSGRDNNMLRQTRNSYDLARR